MEFPFLFTSVGRRVADLGPETRFFVADPMNSSSVLFVARGKFNDWLFRADAEWDKFTLIYRTQLCERISFASAYLTQKWVLIGLVKFRDLACDGPNMYTIFLDYSKPKPVGYPVSNWSISPQYIAWNYEQEEPVFLFSNFSGKVNTYQVNYEPGKCAFQVSQKKELPRYCFRTGVINQIAHTAFIAKEKTGSGFKLNLIDKVRQDFFPREIPLPDIDVNSSSEIILFVSNPRKTGEGQVLRIIVHASTSALHVIIPTSGRFLTLSMDCQNDAGPDVGRLIENPQVLADAGITYDPIAAAHEPLSRLPFICNFGEIVLVAAPSGIVTGFLIDHLDRVRAAFHVDVPPAYPNGLDLFKMRALTETASKAVYVESGEIYRADINPLYFVQHDPRFIIPIMHCATQSMDVFPTLVSETVLRTFWMGEVFNEMLLIEYIRVKNQKFGEKLCSTFAKGEFYKADIDRFQSYRTIENTSKQPIEEFHSFREMVKVPKAVLESVEILDTQTLFSEVLKLLDTDIFRESSYHESMRFHVFLQCSAIKFSLSDHIAMIDPSCLPDSLHPLIKKHWMIRDLLPVHACWPSIDRRDNPLARDEPGAMEKAQRNWWSLRTEKMNMNSGVKAPTRMFEFVEDLTNRMDAGPKFFRLHQYLLGLHLTDPICGL